jgi:hypothetical protein
MFDLASSRPNSADCLPLSDHCPFHDAGDGLCRASLTGLAVDARRRRNFCTGDDHDRCELFLGRALRSSRPQGRIEPWRLEVK